MMKTETKMLVTGDFCPVGRIDGLISRQQYLSIFNDFMPIIKNCDFTVTNLEAPLTQSNKSIRKTGPAIKGNPDSIKALSFAGFDLVTLANNHILDFGEEGLRDTISLCRDNSIDFVGAGMNAAEAGKTYYRTIHNKCIAIVNIAENEFSTTDGENPGAHSLDPVSNFYVIQQAKERSDYVFVIVHGGHEMYPLPSPRMKKSYRFFVDSGADAVLNHHTHCFSGFEIYNGSPIFYSIGNFVFDNQYKRKSSSWTQGFAVEFIIKRKLEFKLWPYNQCAESAGVSLMSQSEREGFHHRIEKFNSIIGDDERLSDEFNKYCQSVQKLYSSYLEPHSNRYVNALRNRGIFPSLLKKNKKLLYANLIRCESHRDVVLRTLSL